MDIFSFLNVKKKNAKVLNCSSHPVHNSVLSLKFVSINFWGFLKNTQLIHGQK